MTHHCDVTSARRLAAAATLLALLVGCSDQPSSSTSSPAVDESRPLTLVMIPKGIQTTFWNQVREGAEKARDETGVELIWKGPVRDNDRSSQKQVMQQFTHSGVDGILLSATDKKALVPDVQTAMAKGIPVLLFDSAVEGEQGKDFISYVATDNLAAGRLGGKHVMQLIGDGGKAILFRHMEGHESTGNRETGALEEFRAAHADILEEKRYSGETASEAQNTALNMIDVIRQADGVFCPNQSSTEGLLLALRQTNLTGKIKVVGFDSSPMLTQALRNGEIDAIVVQDPVRMGYLSVKMMVDYLHKQPIEPLLNTEAHLVTRDNMDDPTISPLLQK